MALALTASVLYPFFFPHYIAAYSCVIFFLIIRGMMILSQWSLRGRVVGPVIVLFLMVGGCMMGLMAPAREVLGLNRHAHFRAQVADRLIRLGGRHVVVVRYGADHSFHNEWVYNAADIDASAIIWCRAKDPGYDNEVMRYFTGRHFWIADVSRDTVRVSSYQPSVSTEYAGPASSDWVLERHPRRGK
jgi:hypothetical protein